MNEENSQLIVEVRELIRGGDFELALDRIKTASHGSSTSLYDEIVLLESRFTRLMRDNRKGLLRREDFETEVNRLTTALLSLVTEASRQFTKPEKTHETLVIHQPTVPFQELTYQQIIGINNLKQISWIEVGLRAAKNVCRILTPEGFGTGFLVGNDMVMTNNHVIGTPDLAAQSKAEFNYQQDESGGFLPAVRYELDPVGFHTSASLDYSLVRIRQDAKKPPLQSWGTLRLNPNADPTPSEHVIVIQHPNGGYKQIVLTANWVIAVKTPVLHYTTDTMPGSSGSPVFNDSWHVIAIHHAGGHLHKDTHGSVRYVNEGVLMSAIREQAASQWPQ
jgi:V8-like Glu-specific endopeptidase